MTKAGTSEHNDKRIDFMPMPRSLSYLALALLTLLPSVAFAHVGHDHGSGLVSGFLHPLGGLDHLLAMLAVGLFAWHLGGNARWLVPVAFVAAMALAGAIGMAGIGVPLVEVGIALSVVVLGLLIALRRRLPTGIAMAIVAGFAVFHGHAHGAEMDPTASGLAYGLGFVLATGLLHGAGILAGMGLASLGSGSGLRIARASGAAIALAGVLILTGAI